MMFAVLGYQLENADVLSALRTARRHLRSSGLLVFDVWYGPAVLRERPSQRLEIASIPNGQIIRAAWGELDALHQLCYVHYRVWRLEENRLLAATEESHTVRLFFPLELALFLECSGFGLIRLGAFPDFERDPAETIWSVLGVARAV